jgi:quercetin dioxygenase-like cupin family protein/AraC-like DNA-binding protein
METKNIEKGPKPQDGDLEMLMLTPRPVVSKAIEYFNGHVSDYHEHSRSQLLYASSGVMTVETGDSMWVVPPLRAVWIPAGTLHNTSNTGHLRMRTLFIVPEYCPGAPKKCCVVSVSPLLKELILYAVKLPELYPLNGPEERIMQVIIDQIQDLDIKPLNLTIPKEDRIKKIYKGLTLNPGDKKTLEEWGNKIGATKRTLSRLFKSETGMGFGQWRQQIRILESLKRLSQDEPVYSNCY